MPHRLRPWASLLALAALGGCAASAPPVPDRAEYELARQALASDAEARATMESTCAEHLRRQPEDERAAVGALLDVGINEVDQVYCERIVAALVRGELDYADFVALDGGSDDPELLRRLVRALRQEPEGLAI